MMTQISVTPLAGSAGAARRCRREDPARARAPVGPFARQPARQPPPAAARQTRTTRSPQRLSRAPAAALAGTRPRNAMPLAGMPAYADCQRLVRPRRPQASHASGTTPGGSCEADGESLQRGTVSSNSTCVAAPSAAALPPRQRRGRRAPAAPGPLEEEGAFRARDRRLMRRSACRDSRGRHLPASGGGRSRSSPGSLPATSHRRGWHAGRPRSAPMRRSGRSLRIRVGAVREARRDRQRDEQQDAGDAVPARRRARVRSLRRRSAGRASARGRTTSRRIEHRPA